MLDIVHYFFESDSLDEKEVHEAKSKMRGTLYTQLYDRPYTWGQEDGGNHEFGTQETASGEVFNSFGSQDVGSPPELTHKPYIPPTPIDVASPKPFGNVLDAPLG